MDSFENLGLSERMVTALGQKGFVTPTPIQAKAIPAILAGDKDLLGQAQTGTGKTAAFGIPLIERLTEKSKNIQALVLTPTRELAVQVAQELESLKGNKRLSILPVYGGDSIGRQSQRLAKGVDIVVGTPGRILDHINRSTLCLGFLSFLILDEADEMLNMGFLPDVEKILESTPANKRTLMFSATMPDGVFRIAKKYMGPYTTLTVAKERQTTELTRQIYYEVSESDRLRALCRVIDIEHNFYGLVFCKTKANVDFVGSRLLEKGYNSDIIHGDLSQAQRESILKKFKSRRISILVATDVAARGIDVQDLSHVVNYELPQDPESYIHRIGRTGRAGKEGTAVTLVAPHERGKMRFICRVANSAVQKATLPRVHDVIETKKSRIKSDIEGLLRATPGQEYLEMGRQILETGPAEEIVAALLQYSFGSELDKKSYDEIQPISSYKPGVSSKTGFSPKPGFTSKPGLSSSKGKTRLLVSGGKNDGLTKSKLMGLIQRNCSAPDWSIGNIQIHDTISFVTLPPGDADTLLSLAKRRGVWKGPSIARAKATS